MLQKRRHSVWAYLTLYLGSAALAFSFLYAVSPTDGSLIPAAGTGVLATASAFIWLCVSIAGRKTFGNFAVALAVAALVLLCIFFVLPAT